MAIAQEVAPLTVSGSGFVIRTLRSEDLAFENRSYIWKNVPKFFDGWQYTRVKGGHAAEINVIVPHETDVYIASAEGAPAGWESVNDGTFWYTDKHGTAMHIYGMHVPGATTLRIPQNGWTGTLVLAPALSGMADAAPVLVRHRTHPVEVVPNGAPLDVVVAGRPAVVHVHHVHRSHPAVRNGAHRSARRVRKP